jgi:hypothetical protein
MTKQIVQKVTQYIYLLGLYKKKKRLWFNTRNSFNKTLLPYVKQTFWCII